VLVTPPPAVVAAAPRPMAAIDTPASGQPWTEREITQTIPRVPRLAYRPIAITLVTAAVVGFVAVKGWIYPLPPSVVTTARNVKARLFGAPPLPPAPDLPATAAPPVAGIGEAASAGRGGGPICAPGGRSVGPTGTATPTPITPAENAAVPAPGAKSEP